MTRQQNASKVRKVYNQRKQRVQLRKRTKQPPACFTVDRDTGRIRFAKIFTQQKSRQPTDRPTADDHDE